MVSYAFCASSGRGKTAHVQRLIMQALEANQKTRTIYQNYSKKIVDKNNV